MSPFDQRDFFLWLLPSSALLSHRVLHLSFRFALSIFACGRLSAGGDDGIRTHDPLLAGQVLSQLSYTPTVFFPLLGFLFSFSRSSLPTRLREHPQKLNNNNFLLSLLSDRPCVLDLQFSLERR